MNPVSPSPKDSHIEVHAPHPQPALPRRRRCHLLLLLCAGVLIVSGAFGIWYLIHIHNTPEAGKEAVLPEEASQHDGCAPGHPMMRRQYALAVQQTVREMHRLTHVIKHTNTSLEQRVQLRQRLQLLSSSVTELRQVDQAHQHGDGSPCA
eukprot:NODE_1323_length_1006_cov_82.593521_g1019_i0.p1 GENE.NODE_1323_length_1006_cov_82.593521_g1019_i0~~NODE_1323_length_1006_cov_82.593521_g1019_i0.p1  ORF type:complete len:170 (+),score=48.20 NODE_1323_length_1006_cov_82.593521_g1019_i0:61-510(+)